MEAFPIEFCRAMKSYWNKRNYHDMNTSGTAKKTKRVARLGRNPRFGMLRLGRKARLRLPSPVQILARLRDAYVDSMLGLAGNRVRFSGQPGPEVLLARRIPNARAVRVQPAGKKFERKFACWKKER